MSFLTNKTVILAYKYLFTCLIYVIASAVVLNIFMHKNFLDNTPKNEVGVCLEYNAVKPWCYRVLVPFSVNAIKATADQLGITKQASKLIKYPKVQDRVEKMKIRYEFKEYVDIANYFIIYGLFFLILLSLLFALRKLTQLLFECHELVYLVAPVVILLLYPLSFVGSGNLYDFLEILFLILALIYLLQEKWALYYLVFGLAILNKESSILLGIYVVAVYFKVYSTKKLISHALLHLIIGIPIFLTIRILFDGNPGGQFWSHFDRNIVFLTNIKNYFLFNDVYSYLIPTPRGYNIITLFLLAFTCLYEWHKKPDFAKKIVLIAYPIFFLLCLVMGNKDEIRNFSFLFPCIYIFGLDTILRVYNSKFKLNQFPVKLKN